MGVMGRTPPHTFERGLVLLTPAVTSAWRRLAETRVVGAGLPLPTVIVPIDEIRNGKPDPEGFLRAAAHLGVAPEECIVFEDTRPGIDAGLSADMQATDYVLT